MATSVTGGQDVAVMRLGFQAQIMTVLDRLGREMDWAWFWND
jgi:hypothetical protein